LVDYPEQHFIWKPGFHPALSEKMQRLHPGTILHHAGGLDRLEEKPLHGPVQLILLQTNPLLQILEGLIGRLCQPVMKLVHKAPTMLNQRHLCRRLFRDGS